jgi:hypothetical protein
MKIDLPYVHTDRDTRSGIVRVYFRRRLGAPKIRLRARPGTSEFLAEYQAALDASGTPAIGSVTPRSYRWLITQYFASSEYRTLDPRTQRVRRGILESTCNEPISPGSRELFGDFPLNRLSAKAIRVLRDRKEHLPEAANGRVKAIRRVFAWAMEAEHITTNPARDVSYKRRVTEGHHTWTEEEIAQFESHHAVRLKGASRARVACIHWRSSLGRRVARASAHQTGLAKVRGARRDDTTDQSRLKYP